MAGTCDHDAAQLDRPKPRRRSQFRDRRRSESKKIRIFTTRIDTIFGANAIIVAPEHELIDELIASGKASGELKKFVEELKSISR